MLQGTLDVFSLDEVLGLLSGANKSGVLNITGDRGVGTVSISDGSLVGGSVSSSPTATELADVVFELLRFEEGSFSFDGSTAPEGEAHELEAVLVAAHSRLGEWQGIEAVVPSLDHRLELNATLTTTQVTLSEAEWATIVAIGEGASVGVVAQRLELGEFDGSKRVKSLIERNLAVISVGTPSPTPAAEVAESFAAPVFETPEPAPMSFDGLGSDPVADEPVEAPVAHEIPEAPAVEAIVEPVEIADVIAEPVDALPTHDIPEAPAFLDDVPVADEIPPMPEAPAFGSFSDEPVDEVATEVPPMPEPPASFEVFDQANEPDDFPMPPPPTPPMEEGFGGLGPIEPADMFEAPRRADDRPADAFGADAFDAPDETPLAPAPAGDDMPSFAPPVSFDADAFGVNDDAEPVEAAADEAGETDEADDKGGSLLMRYLKSNS